VGIVDTLANLANTILPDGINWTEQIAAYGSREASVEFYKNTKDFGPMASGAYYSDLVSARGDTVLAFEKIGVQARMSLQEYQAGKIATQATLDQNSDMLQAAINSATDVLSKPIVLDGPKLRDLLQGYVAILNAGIEMHKSKVIFRMGLTNTQIADHAQYVARGWRQLKYLLSSGVLSPLQKATSGLGDGGLSVGVAFLTLGLVAIVATAIVSGIYVLASLVVAQQACQALIDAKHPDAAKMCALLIPKPPQSTGDIVQQIVLYGAIGLGIYAAINYLPYITSQVSESRRRFGT
jgi:hypothetical protein